MQDVTSEQSVMLEAAMNNGRPRVREDWRELVARFKADKKTLNGFAREIGIHPHTLRRWIHEVEHAAASDEPRALAFVEVEVSPPSFHASASSVEIYMGRDGGVHLRLETLPPASWLAELARRC